jgi:GntR family transcriptional regulator, rspAB operon transcriptional repressor
MINLSSKKLSIGETETIRQKVHKYVREQVLNGEIGPNERLIETKIAHEIGTSRTPVREALHSLEQEGLIESLPRIGYRVKTISDQEAIEIWEIRSAIETLAARWACSKAQKQLVKELGKNIAMAEKEASQGRIENFVDIDGQFHEIIARLSGGTRLLELAQTMRRHALRYRIQSIHHPETVNRAIEGHKAILRAIEDGDLDSLNQAIRNHLDQSKADTLRYAFSDNVNDPEVATVKKKHCPSTLQS